MTITIETPMTMTADDMEFARYGVALSSLGEDGDHYIALGHPPLRRFVAALNAYHREVCGLLGLDTEGDGITLNDVSADVTRRWALFEPGSTASGYNWRLEWCDETTPGAVPVTRWWV